MAALAKGKGKKGKTEDGLSLEDMIGMGVAGLYAIPALMLKQKHWYLSDEEQEELGQAGAAFVKSLPQAKAQKVAKIVAQWGPGVGFATGLAITFGERVNRSLELSRERKARGHSEPPQRPRATDNGHAGEARPGDETDSGRMETPGRSRVRITDIFSQGEG